MAVTKYLDKTGLSHFWSKIKAWCNATFAAITHSHAWSTITGKPTTISGYGITDAKISSGTITLGSNTITPLTSHQTLPTLSRTISGSGNAITDITVSGHAITATKGSTFSLANHTHNNLLSAGDNVASTSTNTYASGYFNVRWFSQADKVPGQPSQYGFLATFATGDSSFELHQLWCIQPNGDLYHRGTNYDSYTSPPAFKKLIDSSNETQLSLTNSGSGNAVTGISVSGHSITATKGSTFLTSHQSLANYVTLNSAQTISAVKTFTAKPVLNQVGLDMTVKDTTEGSTTTRTSQVLHANSSNSSYGINIAFCSGGNAVVGGGEAGTAQLNALAGNNGEDLYLVADGNIYLKTNGNTWTNAKTITLSNAAELSGLAKVTSTSFVGALTGNCSGSSGSCTGNAATATKLATARTINIQDSSATNTGTGASFDGSGNATIKLPATIKATITGNCSGSSGSCTGNAKTATTLQTPRKINGVSFDGSADITVADSTKVPLTGGTMSGYITYKVAGITRSSSTTATYPWGIKIIDSADKPLGGIYFPYSADKSYYNALMCYKSTTTDNAWESIRIGCDKNGNFYTYAPTPAASSNNTNIATTKWVNNKGYITSSGSITGNAATATKQSCVVATNGGYADVVNVTDGTNRVGTIRVHNYNGYTQMLLGVHNESNGAPDGLYVQNNDGVVSAFISGQFTSTLFNGPIYVKPHEAMPTGNLSVDGVEFVEVYEDTGYPHNYGHVLNIQNDRNHGAAQLFLSWCHEDEGLSHLFYRNKRDTTTVWSDWREIAFTTDNITGKSANVTGTVAINHGGTGATTRLNAVKALTNENVGTGATYFLTITNSWGKAGYTSVADTRTVLAMKGATSSAAGTAGVVPAPPTSGYNTKYLRADGTWQVPPDNNTTYSVSTTGSGNAVTSVSLSGTAITATKGTTFLTSHQSLANYVTLNSSQDITGDKKFSWCCSKSTAIDRTATNTTDDQWLISGGYQDKNGKSLIDVGFHRKDQRHWSLRLYDASGTQRWMMFQGINHDGTSPYVSVGGNFHPMDNGDKYCGLSDRRWKAVYAVNGAIQTSDERIKEDIDKLPEAVLDAWDSIEWLQFRMKPSVEKKGSSARLHSGIIAQHARDAFASVGLDASDYGFFCWDQWDKTPAMLDEKGEIAIPERPAGDQYSIRYDEALAIEAAYQRRKNKILEKRMSDLEEQLSSVLEILNNLKGVDKGQA